MSKEQRRGLVKWINSRRGKEETPSKRQQFNHGSSRDKETRTLLPKLVDKELWEIKKAEEREEFKEKEIKAYIMAILEEVKANANSGASTSSNSAISPATSNSLLKSILKKTGSKS